MPLLYPWTHMRNFLYNGDFRCNHNNKKRNHTTVPACRVAEVLLPSLGSPRFFRPNLEHPLFFCHSLESTDSLCPC